MEKRPFREDDSRIAGQEINPPFMEHEGSLLRSQESATGPYPEPDEYSPRFHTLFLSDLFNVNFPSSLRV
jgi:hypothetical protein